MKKNEVFNPDYFDSSSDDNSHKHGYPPECKDMREWNSTIQKMIDAFELMNAKYEKTMRDILAKNNLDYEVLNSLVLKEKELSNSNNAKDEMQSFIDITFKSDMINY